MIVIVHRALTAMNKELDDSIVIGDAANDFDASFQKLLKPYIGVIGTYLYFSWIKTSNLCASFPFWLCLVLVNVAFGSGLPPGLR